MEAVLFKNVGNVRIKGGSFNINQGPATISNDFRTFGPTYNIDHSRHITNNAPVQNYDNRQYSTNYGRDSNQRPYRHRSREVQKDRNDDFQSIYGQERSSSYQPSPHTDRPQFAQSYGSPPMSDKNPFRRPQSYLSPPLTPPVSRHMGGYSATNDDDPYVDQGFVSDQMGSDSSYVRRPKSKLPRSANFGQYVNNSGSPFYLRGAEIQEMTPEVFQAFNETMQVAKEECTAPDSDDSDTENMSLADDMANLDINGVSTSSTTPHMELPLESDPETPSHRKSQKTSKNPFAKAPWPSPEYTPPYFVGAGDGSFPGLRPASIYTVDNRAYTTNINSNNTNNTNIQDSYNDDSTTITKISKGRRK